MAKNITETARLLVVSQESVRASSAMGGRGAQLLEY